jgi:AAA15 family ATPase/GTPase
MEDINGHLRSFKVKNFKRFESFEMDNLGQFNLIVGDNNVGKTSLLEALLVCKPAWIFFNRLLTAMSYRKFKEGLYYGDISTYEYRKGFESGNSKIYFRLESVDKTVQILNIVFNRHEGVITIEGIPGDSSRYTLSDRASINQNYNTPFVPFFKGHDEDLTKFYRDLQISKSKKENFIKALKIIIPDIQNIELSIEKTNNYLIIYQEHIDATIPLAFFGDGALKVFRLLAEIILNKDGRLMIDEIDTGIHFSRFKGFWKTILLAAKQNNVQLFMTTHNEECIKYFIDVLSSEDMLDLQKDARAVTLRELPDKSVKSYTYPFENLETVVLAGNDVRGGSL